MDRAPIVIFGCGFTGTAVAKLALAQGHRVIGTTQSPEKIAALAQIGVEAHALSLGRDVVRELVPAGARVLVALPPDGKTDREIALALGVGSAARVVYISTTGVFGGARGRVDESTPTDAREASSARRLDAERLYGELEAGGTAVTVLRPAGIYGPFRGLHRRLLGGEFRIPGAGTNVVSRIHVHDLAAIAFAILGGSEARPRGGTPAVGSAGGTGEVFVVADDAPVPQMEAIEWLCQRLGVPLPPHAALDDVSPTLRHDRSVDNARVKRELGLRLAYPSYREGFEACLVAEGFSRAGEVAPP